MPDTAKEAGAQSKKGSGRDRRLPAVWTSRTGKYVLVDDRMSDYDLADLETDGFPTEEDFFAKHMGHKVTVRGTSNLG